MSRASLAAILCCLAACQQGAKPGANSMAGSNADVAPPAPMAAPAPVNSVTTRPSAPPAAVPASYDWTFATHGGSGELVFGDGDLAEGVSLLTLSCLPGSGQAEVSGMSEGPATLRAEGASATIAAGAPLAINHPVMRGLQASGSLTLGDVGGERVLTAKPGLGRVAVESFLTYCSQG